MSEARHTPGPWVLTDTGGHDIATVERKPPEMEGPNYYWTVASVNTLRPEWRANARLISAAPELLEALSWLVDILPDPELDNDELQRTWTKKARAAISKATS